jgi:hypothetical protein
MRRFPAVSALETTRFAIIVEISDYTQNHSVMSVITMFRQLAFRDCFLDF